MNPMQPQAAAEFLTLPEEKFPEAGSEGASPWPPYGWFTSEGVEEAPGQPFVWSPPVAGFGPETARDWIDRAIRMQRYYLDVVGVSPSNWNDPRGSALGNANLMIENLGGRWAAPAYPRRLYRGRMDTLVGDEELQELLVLRDWLESVVARVEKVKQAGERRRHRAKGRRLRTNWKRGVIYLDDKPLREDVKVCLYIEAMIQLRDRTPREEIAEKMRALAAGMEEFRGVRFSKLERLQKRIIHKQLEGVIDSQPGGGTRIKPKYLA